MIFLMRFKPKHEVEGVCIYLPEHQRSIQAESFFLFVSAANDETTVVGLLRFRHKELLGSAAVGRP